MIKTFVFRPALAVALLTAFCVLLFNPSRASANGSRCSNATLVGDFGYSAEGVLMGTPGLPPEAQFRSTGVAHLDGSGNGTWVEHTVINGVSLEVGWTSATLAYRVKANCTGLMVVDTPNSPVPLNLYFVIVKEGTEFRTVLDNSAISAVFTRVQ
jgi:hypothetical protein